MGGVRYTFFGSGICDIGNIGSIPFGDNMKCLSIAQPWSALLLSGKKNIEIRTWNTKFRGRFWIHAPKKIDLQACSLFKVEPKSLTTGALVGMADLVGVKRYDHYESFEMDRGRHLNLPEWFKEPMYGFVLENILRLEKPVPYKGALNFFEVAEQIMFRGEKWFKQTS